MASHRVESNVTKYILLLTFMVYSLTPLVKSNSTEFEEKGFSHGSNKNTSNKTGKIEICINTSLC